mmetsp:Transcript_104699/g.249294  ORF Transcript_104699/g.249294 Transcript_104699/m.249294 type:complete len:235 (-) Transcript_104699:27-731(-)
MTLARLLAGHVHLPGHHHPLHPRHRHHVAAAVTRASASTTAATGGGGAAAPTGIAALTLTTSTASLAHGVGRASALAGAALPGSALGSGRALPTVALTSSSAVLLVHHLLGVRMLRVLLGAIHGIRHDHGSTIRSHLHAHVLLHVALLWVHVGMAMSLYLLALAHGRVALHSIGHGMRRPWGGHALWVHGRHLVGVLQHLRGKMASLHPEASTLLQGGSSLRELELHSTRTTAN